MLRFSIAPIKDMSLSDLRVAITSYILSKQLNEDLLVRIDDTEKEKNIEGKEKEILETLSLFSIDYINAIYQSENLKYHQKLAMQLMGQKKAFACFCSDEKLSELKEYDDFCSTLSDETVLNCNAPFTVRAKRPEKNKKPFDFDSFIILNHDKTPTQIYASAIDDMISNVSRVVLSDDSNIVKEIHIRNQLNYDKKIEYIFVSNIKENDVSITKLINEGFLPSAIANYLVLLGNKTPTEVFTLEEAIEWFDITNSSNDDLEFDIEKLKEINKKHLKTMDELRLSKILGFADADIGKLAKLFLEEASTIKEIKSKLDLIFAPKSTIIDFEEQFVELKLCLNGAPYFNNFDELKAYITEKTDLEGENLSKPLRYILTGREDGPDILEVYPLIKNYLGEIIK